MCKCENKHTSIVTTVTPERPGIPRAMGYGCFVISPVTGLVCHRHPCEAFASQELDSSVGEPEQHDLTVRKQAPSSMASLASTAARPALLTLRNAPLVGQDG